MLASNTAQVPVQNDPMPQVVAELLQQHKSLWWECDTSTPVVGRTYTVREQAATEKQLERFLNTLSGELNTPPRSAAESQALQDRIVAAARSIARSSPDFEERYLDFVLSCGFVQGTTQFAQAARRFDPAIRAEDIFQASRNAWTMYALQLLLGLPVTLTPAVFAYSMLYPYSDNYLDDPAIPAATKVAFDKRFAQRLAGETVAPANAHERTIYDLVSMVESQYGRARHPQVFASLQAIHRAQDQSLRLLRRHASPYEVDVLGLVLKKGAPRCSPMVAWWPARWARPTGSSCSVSASSPNFWTIWKIPKTTCKVGS
jgi:hypothetical protein